MSKLICSLFICLIVFSRLTLAQTFNTDIEITKGPTEPSAINLKNGNGFWHISGPRSQENNNNLTFFWHNNTSFFPRITFQDNGNIGVGITSATARLSVFHDWPLGNVGKNATLITSFAGLTGAVNGNNLQENLWLVRNHAGVDWLTARIHNGIAIDGSFQQPQIDTHTWWERDPYGNIQSWGDQQNTYMTINQGNVGIGTIDPQAKLGVNGLIRAKEIKVETANWPDYVFKSAYKLQSLNTVKAYIDKNKHLPEMPSEAEVAKDGVNLGEIVKLQTKKIEELTLYLIRQQEEINQLRRRVNLGKKSR